MPLGSELARNRVISQTLGPTQGGTIPDPLFLALFLDDPTVGGTEVSGDGYQRVPIAKTLWEGPDNGAMTTGSDLEFQPSLASWGAVRFVALMDDLDNVWDYGSLPQVVVVPSAGFVVQFLAGDLTVKEG